MPVTEKPSIHRSAFRGGAIVAIQRARSAARVFHGPSFFPEQTGVRTLDLKPQHCRWIDGEPRGLDTLYCGAPATTHSDGTRGPYCEDHAAVCFAPRRR